jgi:DMSO/TMAO reductase YedYZ molybdopterin-dependent catalytic subunit
VAHYQGPFGPAIDETQWTLEITGLVKRPLTVTLDQLKARPRQEVIFTLECAGNHGFSFFIGGIGTATWAGTPLAPLLEEAGVLDKGIEVVFVGSNVGEEEVRDTRLMGRFMARDYVTIREEQRNGDTVWMESSVGRVLLKSVPTRVTRKNGQYRIVGAAWGAPIQRVEVQIDGGPWMPATIDRGVEAEFAWKIWSFEWAKPASGEHTITSRAIDMAGRIQPAMDDPWIAKKRTYWESNGQVTRQVRLT